MKRICACGVQRQRCRNVLRGQLTLPREKETWWGKRGQDSWIMQGHRRDSGTDGKLARLDREEREADEERDEEADARAGGAEEEAREAFPPRERKVPARRRPCRPDELVRCATHALGY